MSPHRRLTRKLVRQLGRRGAFLLLVGSAWIVYGVGLVIRSGIVSQSRFPNMTIPVVVVLSSPLSGVAWVLAGLAGVICAFRSRAGEDAIGFVALQLLPLLWCLMFLSSWALSLVNGHTSTDWMMAAIWAAAVAAVYVVSGWPEVSSERVTSA